MVRRPAATASGSAKSGSAADVRDMHDPAFERHPPGNAVATGDNCSLARDRPILGPSHCEVRHIAIDLALAYRDRCGYRLPQSRAAVSTTVSSTGCTSEVERLMTLSTSLVAVWYSSDSCRSSVRCRRSSNSRAFSIAITAWSAKVVTSSICAVVKGLTARRPQPITPIGWPSRRIGTPRNVR